MSIASVLTMELLRIARKEVRGETVFLRKAVASSHREIAALKRRADELEKELRGRATASPDPEPASTSGTAGAMRETRFSAKGFTSRRRRLELSARDCGLLIGASAQSIYNWEAGKGHPRGKHLAALNSLFAMSKKDVAARLKEIDRPPVRTGGHEPA